MSRLSTRLEADLQPETLNSLAPVRVNGKLAEVYLQFAGSEQALRAYLQMEQSVQAGSLMDREIEAVKLWVSQQTGCDYCLSVHSFKARKAGLDDSAQRAIRQGVAMGDDRVDCLLKLARVLFTQPGKLDDDLLAEARNTGLTDENLIDLTLAISTIVFTNLTNHINDSQSPLPPASAL